VALAEVAGDAQTDVECWSIGSDSSCQLTPSIGFAEVSYGSWAAVPSIGAHRRYSFNCGTTFTLDLDLGRNWPAGPRRPGRRLAVYDSSAGVVYGGRRFARTSVRCLHRGDSDGKSEVPEAVDEAVDLLALGLFCG
jgi:hypothetical protein